MVIVLPGGASCIGEVTKVIWADLEGLPSTEEAGVTESRRNDVTQAFTVFSWWAVQAVTLSLCTYKVKVMLKFKDKVKSKITFLFKMKEYTAMILTNSL